MTATWKTSPRRRGRSSFRQYQEQIVTPAVLRTVKHSTETKPLPWKMITMCITTTEQKQGFSRNGGHGESGGTPLLPEQVNAQRARGPWSTPGKTSPRCALVRRSGPDHMVWTPGWYFTGQRHHRILSQTWPRSVSAILGDRAKS